MTINRRRDALRRLTATLLFFALALVWPCANAQQDTKLYSVATIALSHPDENVRRHFVDLASNFSRLQSAAGTNARFLFSTSEQINAFATIHRGEPIVVVNKGLLAHFRDDKDAVSAVLAHELGHVRRNHVTIGTQAQAAIQFIAGLAGLLIDINQARRGHDSRVGLGQLGAEIGGTLASKAYTRDQEREADADSVSILIDAGIHPRAAARVHERFTAEASGGEPLLFLASHPPSSERTANINRAITESATRIAAKVPDPGALSGERLVSEEKRRALAESKRLEEMTARIALLAKADEEFALRQSAALRLEKEVMPGTAKAKSVRSVAEPEGDCRERGPNKRMCASVDPSGRSVLKSCERSGSAWECRTISGGGQI